MMVNAGVARTRRDGRRWTMLGISPRKTRSEGRDVKTTGGALARRGCVGFGGCSDARPPTMQKTTGGAATSPVKDMLAGLGVAAAIHVKTTGGALSRRSISEATSVSELQGRLHAVFPATADGIGQYEGIGNPTAQPQQMASATVWASKRASVCTRIAAVDAEMAWCNSAENR
jgi:hypothetical protein